MTNVSLKEYIDRRIDELDQRLLDRFTQSDSSVAKAERTMNERLNSMNEFRDALRDQANRMATRAEVEKMNEEIQELRRAKSNLDGRMVILNVTVSAAVSILTGLLVGAVLMMMSHWTK